MLRLRLGGELHERLRFVLSATGINGGPARRATKAGLYNYHRVFQDIDPSAEFEEAYFDMDLPPVDLRLGLQKIAWGKLDRTQPNDLFNPYRYHDYFLLEQEENKIGVPAARIGAALPQLSWLPEDGRITVAWAPNYVPFRFPLPGERWFPPAAQSLDRFHVPDGVIVLPSGRSLPAFDIPVAFGVREAGLPPRRLENSGLGVRVSGFLAGFDHAMYFYYGYDIAPAFRLLADVFAQRDAASPLGASLAARATLEPVFRHIEAWGADTAYAFGPVTVRAEGAFVRGRAFTRDLRLLVSDPTPLLDQADEIVAAILRGAAKVPVDLGPSFVERDAVEWGIGVDYTYRGWLALLQVNQTDVLDNDVDLLIHDIETRILANIRKSFLRDRLQSQLVALQGIESAYTLLRPRLTLALTDRVQLRGGYLAIAGSRHTVLGQYKANDEGFLQLRVSF